MKNNKNVTSLLLGTMPWLCISFVANLVMFSPLYFVFPIVKYLLARYVPVRQRIIEIFWPLRDYPIVSWIAYKSEQVAEIVLLVAWLYLAFSLSTLLLNLIRTYITYVLKAGHISVVGSLIRGEEVKGQLTHGLHGIGRRFGSVNLMYIGDVLEVNSLLFRDDGKMPDFIKKNRFLSWYLRGLVRAVLIHLDEVLLSYVMTSEGNVWKIYCEGLSKYLKAWKTIIKDSLKTVLAVSLLSGLLHVFVYGTVFLSIRHLDMESLILALVLARYLMFCVKVTFLEAYEYIRMLIVFYDYVGNEGADESLLAKLKEHAPSLKKLMKKGGLRSQVGEVADAMQQNVDLDGVGLEELVQMAESKLVPDSLEHTSYLQKLKNIVKRRISHDSIRQKDGNISGDS